MKDNDLLTITKYLLNYLFKKIDDLTEENRQLKIAKEVEAAETNLLQDISQNAVAKAMLMAKQMGIIDADEEVADSEDDDDLKN